LRVDNVDHEKSVAIQQDQDAKTVPDDLRSVNTMQRLNEEALTSGLVQGEGLAKSGL